VSTELLPGTAFVESVTIYLFTSNTITFVLILYWTSSSERGGVGLLSRCHVLRHHQPGVIQYSHNDYGGDIIHIIHTQKNWNYILIYTEDLCQYRLLQQVVP
jgi:hypothetical protein